MSELSAGFIILEKDELAGNIKENLPQRRAGFLL